MGFLKKSGRLYAVFRRARRRVGAASAAQVLLDFVALLATAIQVVLPVLWAAQKTSAQKVAWLQASVFLVFVIYSLIHRHFLSRLFKPKRLKEEEQRRPLRLSGAVGKFTLATISDSMMNLTRVGEIERSLLEIIKSEVESLIGDTTGAYLMVNLLLLNEENHSQLVCVNRTDTARQFPKFYNKEGMKAWESMQSGKSVYVPSYHGSSHEPYKCILCLPLVYADPYSGQLNALGAVTIDHSSEDEFDGLVEKMEIVLSPYLRLLELAVVWRKRLPADQIRKLSAENLSLSLGSGSS